MENTITYVHGDATEPEGKGNKLIVHCCNDIGAWGAGFVLALSKKWDNVERMYRFWHKNNFSSFARPNGKFELGNVQFVEVKDNIYIGNMIGQHGIGKSEYKNPPIRYHAIKSCLQQVRLFCIERECSVHAPKFGSALAGGDWSRIEKIIKEELLNHGISVTIYLFD